MTWWSSSVSVSCWPDRDRARGRGSRRLRRRARRQRAARATSPPGKKVFVAFCGKCHTMAAAGSTGTLGPNLDQDAVTFSAVVTAIEEGVGGIQAEYVLRSVTFSQIYDVAKFVVTDRAAASAARRRLRASPARRRPRRSDLRQPRPAMSAFDHVDTIGPQPLWDGVVGRSVHGEQLTLGADRARPGRRGARAQPRQRAARAC